MEKLKFNEQEVREGAPFAALSYVLFLWILTFILKKDNAFARHHARQGIVIFIGTMGCFPFIFVPGIGVLFKLLALGLAIAALYGIVLSVTGKTDPIYLVSEIAKRLVV